MDGKLRIGDKIKCVNGKFHNESTNPFRLGDIQIPKKGSVYTVREVVETNYGTGLRLEEIKNRKFYFQNIKRFEEPIFIVARFKKI